MDVLLDTNAFLASGIDSAAFKALTSYLKKTRSTLLIPLVVIEELCAHRRTALEKLKRDLQTAYKDLDRLLPDIMAEPPALDSDLALRVYRKELMTSAEKVKIIKNLPADLTELVRRLTGRIRPSSSRGEEARDVLIWLAVLRIARAGHVAFITADEKAFFHSGEFHPELRSELGACQDNLKVFLKIDEFLRTHYTRSSFIDEAWVSGRIETEQFIQALDDFIHERLDDYSERSDYIFGRYFSRKGVPANWSMSLLQVIRYNVEDFFVSDLAPDKLYVSVRVRAELEVEVEYLVEHYERTEEDYFKQEKFRVRPQKLRPFTEYVYPLVIIQVHFEVAGKELESMEVASIKMA
jgi:hypothetical protein